MECEDSTSHLKNSKNIYFVIWCHEIVVIIKSKFLG